MIKAIIYLPNQLKTGVLEIRDNTTRINTVLISLANTQYNEKGWR